jgi:hypothetical protein
MAEGTKRFDRTPIALAALLGGFLVAGLGGSRLMSGTASPASGLPDLSSAQIVEIRDARGRTVLSGDFRERTDPMGNIEKDAALVDRRGRQVIGEVEIEIPGPASTSTQELEIDIIQIEPNAKYSVYVDDSEIATFTTDDRGSIDTEIHAAVKR